MEPTIEVNQTVFYFSIFSILVVLIVLVLLTYLRKSSYNNYLHRAVLESMRSSYEKQLYEINEKLLYNENRWRDVNHLLIRKEYTDDKNELDFNKQLQLNGFLRSNGLNDKDLAINKKLVFVLTPFHPQFENDYKVIKETCENVGLNCIRGDETYFSSDIFPEMLKFIVKANLIIANINGRNPNVFYELGIAQALDKPVILISKEPENLPIDIKSKRFLIYKDFNDLEVLLHKELIKVLTR